MPIGPGRDHIDAMPDLDKPSTPVTAWNITPRNPHAVSLPGENEVGVLQRSIKKLSWSQANNNNNGSGAAAVGGGGGPQRTDLATVMSKQDFLGSTDNVSAGENNLTVYF